MYAICIESSHARGMGHFFRALQIIAYCNQNNMPYILLINNDEKSLAILQNKQIKFEVVDLQDYTSQWEKKLIQKYNICLWINDRLHTDIRHTQIIKDCGIMLVTFDDKGNGAQLADYNIAAMTFVDTENLPGKNKLIGLDYLILNKEIDKYKRLRTFCGKIIVTLGGSDTYGVTLKVVNILKQLKKSATVILGPSFAHYSELVKCIDENFILKRNVPSLIKEFKKHDLAITGGGVTPFEANASGLPCIIIANEPHEIEVGDFLHKLGTSIFAGFHTEIDERVFFQQIDLVNMSERGMKSIKINALENIFEAIKYEQKNSSYTST